MMKAPVEVTFSRFDAAKYLGSEEAIAAYLEESAASGDTSEMLNALATIARARNMTALAESTGMSRSGLYKALSSDGNPSFALVDKIAKAMGYRVSLVPLIRQQAKEKKSAGRVAVKRDKLAA